MWATPRKTYRKNRGFPLGTFARHISLKRRGLNLSAFGVRMSQLSRGLLMSVHRPAQTHGPSTSMDMSYDREVRDSSDSVAPLARSLRILPPRRIALLTPTINLPRRYLCQTLKAG